MMTCASCCTMARRARHRRRWTVSIVGSLGVDFLWGWSIVISKAPRTPVTPEAPANRGLLFLLSINVAYSSQICNRPRFHYLVCVKEGRKAHTRTGGRPVPVRRALAAISGLSVAYPCATSGVARCASSLRRAGVVVRRSVALQPPAISPGNHG